MSQVYLSCGVPGAVQVDLSLVQSLRRLLDGLLRHVQRLPGAVGLILHPLSSVPAKPHQETTQCDTCNQDKLWREYVGKKISQIKSS